MKLLIADDERIIRETISTAIDWASLGIELIGTAANGIEAYNIILDEYPDIVLTDIRMPGLSGLELIDRIKKINQSTEFIILSGYDDFKYAQAAIEYGVRSYLLKPCNENQIIKCIQDIKNRIAPKGVPKHFGSQDPLAYYFESNILLTIISEGISIDKDGKNSNEDGTFTNIYSPYHKYLNFDNDPYQLCYLFFVEKTYLKDVMDKITVFHTNSCPDIVLNIIYVNNTLLCFYKSFGMNIDAFDNFMNDLNSPYQNVSFQYQREHFNNLELLLNTILLKIKRYETIYYSVDGNNFIHICNYKTILQAFDQSVLQLKNTNPEIVRNALAHYKQLIEPITDINLLKQIASSSVMQIAAFYMPSAIMSASEKLYVLNQIPNSKKLSSELIKYMVDVIESHLQNDTTLKISEQIKKLVVEHLGDPNLSLKWIAENYLYMNVDYLSKKFLSETDEKFSNYLTKQRITRSKILLKEYNSVDKIKMIAELVGCGNNPQYFSQIFKKETGISPSNYIKSTQEE